VDASERGLGFHVAVAQHQVGPVQLCISPNPMQQIKLRAEIAWMDQAKKSGGLRFTDVTAEARNQICGWLTHPTESEISGRKLLFPPCAPKAETAPWLHEGSGTPDLRPPSPTLRSVWPARADTRAISIPGFSSIPTTAFLPELFQKLKQMSVPRPRLPLAFTTSFLILVFAIMPVLFLKSFRREIGSSLIRIGEKLKGNGESHANASSLIPVENSNSSPESAPSATHPIPETPANEASDESGLAASAQTIQGMANSRDSRPADRQNPGQKFANEHSGRDRSALARRLWSAVGAGDSSAAVPLAQLYVRGDGVPRNCEQARILLRAAAKKGSTEALQELRKVNSTPCR